MSTNPQSDFRDSALDADKAAEPQVPDSTSVLDKIKWYSLHGWLDLAQEIGLIAAGAAAAYESGNAGIAVAAVSAIGAAPDMAHSYYAGKYGDGSNVSAEKSAELEAQGVHEDPQTRYEKTIVCLAYVLAHKNPLMSFKMTDDAYAYATDVLKENKGLFFMEGFPYLNVKDYPNEAGRSMEGIGKVIQTFIGVPGMAIDAAGGALQITAGLLNVAAVAADFVPERGQNDAGVHLVQYLSGRCNISPENRKDFPDAPVIDVKQSSSAVGAIVTGGLNRAAGFVYSHPQRVAGGMQLVSSFVQAASSYNYGYHSWQGILLGLTAAIGVTAYGCKTMANKRGQSLDHG